MRVANHLRKKKRVRLSHICYIIIILLYLQFYPKIFTFIDYLNSLPWLQVRQIILSQSQDMSFTKALHNCDFFLKGNIFTVNLDKARRCIENHSWVENANIRLTLPGTITIDIEPAIPKVFWWINNDNKFLLTSTGKIIAPIEDSSKKKNLLVIFGENARDNYKKIYQQLYRFNFFYDIVSLSMIGDRRWNIYLKNQIFLQLPEEDVAMAAQIADFLWSNPAVNQDLKSIDLRLFKEKIYLKYKEDVKNKR